jgi:hypothetical protein
MGDEINPMTGLPWAGPKQKRSENDAESRDAAPEGEGGALPGLSAEPEAMDDEEPPEPAFLIRENAFGPGAHSVKFVDGTPVGVWLHAERHNADPGAVHAELTALGLPEPHASDFARRRALRMQTAGELQAMIDAAPEDSALKVFLRSEAERDGRMEPLRAAFIKAQGKK